MIRVFRYFKHTTAYVVRERSLRVRAVCFPFVYLRVSKPDIKKISCGTRITKQQYQHLRIKLYVEDVFGYSAPVHTLFLSALDVEMCA